MLLVSFAWGIFPSGHNRALAEKGVTGAGDRWHSLRNSPHTGDSGCSPGRGRVGSLEVPFSFRNMDLNYGVVGAFGSPWLKYSFCGVCALKTQEI